jgi:hypothetical protein
LQILRSGALGYLAHRAADKPLIHHLKSDLIFETSKYALLTEPYRPKGVAWFSNNARPLVLFKTAKGEHHRALIFARVFTLTVIEKRPKTIVGRRRESTKTWRCSFGARETGFHSIRWSDPNRGIWA